MAGAEHGPVAHGPTIKARPGKSVQSDINVTPLIDVVLVLLIIFMVLTPILIEEMAVNLPDKTEVVEEQDLPEQQLVAATCQDGTYVLNRAKLELPALQGELAKRLRSRSSRIVFVDAHPDVDYSRVVDLIDAVRAAGADKVGMATLKTEEEFTACTDTVAGLPTPGAPGAYSGGVPVILGNLEGSLISSVIESNINQVSSCYLSALASQPGMSGAMSVKFTITSTGAVSNAEAKGSTLNNPAVEDCVAGRLRAFVFPAPTGGGEVIVTYPFVFSPG